MNAVNHPVSPIGTLRWLLGAVLGEPRRLPLCTVDRRTDLAMSTIGIAFGLFAPSCATRLHIDGEDVNINA